MAMFLITYNLEFPQENEKAVRSLLKNLKAREVLDSVWLVRKESSVKALTDTMYRAAYVNDKLVVAELVTFQVSDSIEDLSGL